MSQQLDFPAFLLALSIHAEKEGESLPAVLTFSQHSSKNISGTSLCTDSFASLDSPSTRLSASHLALALHSTTGTHSSPRDCCQLFLRKTGVFGAAHLFLGHITLALRD